MKRALQKAGTHATALLVGALLFPAFSGVLELLHLSTPAGSAAGGVASVSDSAAGEEPAGQAAPTSRSEAFRQAWREISLRPATREQRLATQRKLLSLWADYDLEGAIQAAAAEGGSFSFEGNNTAQLNEIFASFFKQHPEEAWRILSKNELGTDQSQLLARWVEGLYDRPEILIAHLAEMSPAQRHHALAMLQIDAPTPPASVRRAAFLKSGLDDAALADALVSKQALTPSDSMDWTTQPSGPQRTAARADWVAHLATLDPAAYAAAWDTVPAADRPEVARLTVSMLHDSPLLLPALDQLVATGQWSVLGSDVISSALRPPPTADPFAPRASEEPSASTPDGPDTAAVAAWALNLPDRPETALLVNQLSPANDPFAPDLIATRLELFPAGTWQRDEITLTEIPRLLRNNTNIPAAEALAAGITSPARQQQAQEILRRAALLRSMR